MRAVLVGFGAVGANAATQLLAAPGLSALVVVRRDASRPIGGLDRRASVKAAVPDDVDVVVLAVPVGAPALAEAALRRGAHVVATCDEPHQVAGLLALDHLARRAGRTLVVGAALAPGLGCVLALQAAATLDRVEEVHVASLGTGGPACARRHHHALHSMAVDWVGGAWHRRPGGSGRELVWFPEPLGGADCYRAALADPTLLLPAFPEARRLTARPAATRRDRTTAWLPMLRPPHPEGREGAVRVEVRGWRDGRAETEVLGAVARPALAAGAVAAVAACWAYAGRLSGPGAAGLASLVPDPAAYLRDVRPAGVVITRFEGVQTFASVAL